MKKKAATKKKVVATKPDVGLIPADLLAALMAAVTGGHYLCAVWSVADEKVNLFRTAVAFPKADLDAAMALLKSQIEELKR